MKEPTLPSTSDTKEKGTLYYCGTLVYTRGGLFVLFSWMLLGDFCFTLMETVGPSIIPLVLKAHDAPNFVMVIVMSTIPGALNFILNPIISTTSDRFRSKYGRRIPFLLFATPFISIFLMLLGFAEPIGRWLHAQIDIINSELTASTVIIILICIFIALFRFFDLFVSTVFYYLFNDVVPMALMGRFIGLFKVVGGLAGIFYQFFVFQYATSHTSVIFFCAAALYFVCFTLMCLNIKEGEYPPPEKMTKKRGFTLEPVKVFFKECFGERIYRFLFLYSSIYAFTGMLGMFTIFMHLDIGLTLADIGKVGGIIGIANLCLLLPMGMLVDKLHPVRVMLITQFTAILFSLMKCIFLFRDFSHDVTFWIYLSLAAIALPFYAATNLASLPMMMQVLPHSKFGQFAAANAMVASATGIIGGILGGLFMDFMKQVLADYGNYYYRIIPIWPAFFGILALGAYILFYREWKRLGGLKGNYQPPGG